MRFLAFFLLAAWMMVPAYAGQEPDIMALQTQAGRGDVGAELALSSAYLEGSGVNQDFAQSYFWAVLAQNNSRDGDDTRAAIDLQNKSALYLSHAQKIGEQNKAGSWYPKK